jgi:putative alpha-1,2-mannosidase
MGSLSVLLKMGIFEMHGGADVKPYYDLGSPLFDKVTIHLNSNYYSGDEFVIETTNNSSKNRYIQSSTLNEKPLEKAWFYHDELVKGGKLLLNMGDKPNKDWGSSPASLPPSMSRE